MKNTETLFEALIRSHASMSIEELQGLKEQYKNSIFSKVDLVPTTINNDELLNFGLDVDYVIDKRLGRTTEIKEFTIAPQSIDKLDVSQLIGILIYISATYNLNKELSANVEVILPDSAAGVSIPESNIFVREVNTFGYDISTNSKVIEVFTKLRNGGAEYKDLMDWFEVNLPIATIPKLANFLDSFGIVNRRDCTQISVQCKRYLTLDKVKIILDKVYDIDKDKNNNIESVSPPNLEVIDMSDNDRENVKSMLTRLVEYGVTFEDMMQILTVSITDEELNEVFSHYIKKKDTLASLKFLYKLIKQNKFQLSEMKKIYAMVLVSKLGTLLQKDAEVRMLRESVVDCRLGITSILEWDISELDKVFKPKGYTGSFVQINVKRLVRFFGKECVRLQLQLDK